MEDKEVTNIFPIDPNYLLWVTIKGESGKTYYIVSNKFRTEYYLFKENKQTAKKSINPMDLEKYVK